MQSRNKVLFYPALGSGNRSQKCPGADDITAPHAGLCCAGYTFPVFYRTCTKPSRLTNITAPRHMVLHAPWPSIRQGLGSRAKKPAELACSHEVWMQGWGFGLGGGSMPCSCSSWVGGRAGLALLSELSCGIRHRADPHCWKFLFPFWNLTWGGFPFVELGLSSCTPTAVPFFVREGVAV